VLAPYFQLLLHLFAEVAALFWHPWVWDLLAARILQILQNSNRYSY
jgi:hypothetical protein